MPATWKHIIASLLLQFILIERISCESEAEVENLTDQNQKIIYPEEFLDTLSKLSDVSQILKSLSKICSIIIIYYHFLLRRLLYYLVLVHTYVSLF